MNHKKILSALLAIVFVASMCASLASCNNIPAPTELFYNSDTDQSLTYSNNIMKTLGLGSSNTNLAMTESNKSNIAVSLSGEIAKVKLNGKSLFDDPLMINVKGISNYSATAISADINYKFKSDDLTFAFASDSNGGAYTKINGITDKYISLTSLTGAGDDSIAPVPPIETPIEGIPDFSKLNPQKMIEELEKIINKQITKEKLKSETVKDFDLNGIKKTVESAYFELKGADISTFIKAIITDVTTNEILKTQLTALGMLDDISDLLTELPDCTNGKFRVTKYFYGKSLVGFSLVVTDIKDASIDLSLRMLSEKGKDTFSAKLIANADQSDPTEISFSYTNDGKAISAEASMKIKEKASEDSTEDSTEAVPAKDHTIKFNFNSTTAEVSSKKVTDATVKVEIDGLSITMPVKIIVNESTENAYDVDVTLAVAVLNKIEFDLKLNLKCEKTTNSPLAVKAEEIYSDDEASQVMIDSSEKLLLKIPETMLIIQSLMTPVEKPEN